MSLSKPIPLKGRTSGPVIEARRVAQGDDGQFVESYFGAFNVPPGDWVVEVNGISMPMRNETVRALFIPRDETLLKRWNENV